MEQECSPSVLDSSHRALLGICMYIFGFVGLTLNIWLVVGCVRKNDHLAVSYVLILQLGLTGLVRNTLDFFFNASSLVANRWLFGSEFCQLSAFLSQSTSVTQIFNILFICLDCFVSSRTNREGAPLRLKFYSGAILSSWTVSLLLATLPLFETGKYNFDFTGVLCDVDWQAKDEKQLFYNYSVILPFGIVPFAIIFVLIYKTLDQIQPGKRSRREVLEQISRNQAIKVLVLSTLILKAPEAVLIMWSFGYDALWSADVPVALIVIARLSSQAHAIAPVLSYLAYDARLRFALVGRG